MGQPTLRYPSFSGAAKNNPVAIAVWIMQNVPCFAGKVPTQWANAVVDKLRFAGVDDRTGREAFKIAKAKGWDFDVSYSLNPFTIEVPPYIPPPPVPHQHYGSFSESDRRRMNINAARLYEVKYRRAMMVHNVVAMRNILKLLLDIFAYGGQPFGELEEQRKKMEEVRLEVMRNAPTASRAIKFGPPGRLLPLRGARLRRIDAWTYAVIDEDVLGEQAAGEEEAEREGE